MPRRFSGTLPKQDGMRKSLMVLLSAVLLTVFGSWGYLIHRTVNQLAVYELPKTVRPFFYRNMDYLVKESIRPDVRRNTDSTEASKHFIDFEAYGDSAAWKMPLKWEEAVARFSTDTLLKWGYVPYEIMRVKEALTRSFRSMNRDSILFYAADLGHYIGDAHVPLHTTINYNGQLTDQRGLHSLWESMVPEIELSNYTLSSRHKARYLPEPEKQVWSALRNSFSLVPDLLQMEKKASIGLTPEQKFRTQVRNGREVKSYSTLFAKAYSRLLRNTVNEQLLSTSDLIADMWYTSWVDGGKPDLAPLLNPVVTKGERKALYHEVKWFKRNQLIKNKKLIARNAQAADTE
jgi:hypothetical protein